MAERDRRYKALSVCDFVFSQEALFKNTQQTNSTVVSHSCEIVSNVSCIEVMTCCLHRKMGRTMPELLLRLIMSH